jgi:DNA polymerase-3 subunit gamma/tau
MSLATKYRPQSFDQVVEQSATKVILEQQLKSGDIKNAYLFCGSAGTGKTTCARIFANELNQHKGIPIELDAASNNSVDDVREIIQQSKTTSLDSEYKVFIIDECHALSNQAWQAMLKVLEEPPKKSIFILCTTDPQKIPKTILSRVQRFDFQRISQQAIFDRLCLIVRKEVGCTTITIEEALYYIAKQAQGGMRDALTMLDKCLAYSEDLTIENVTKALGMADYDILLNLFRACLTYDSEERLRVIDEVYMSGKDLKQFLKSFTGFILDFNKWLLGAKEYLDCPLTDEITSAFLEFENFECAEVLLGTLIKLQAEIKWDTNPRARLEAWCITGE